MNGEYRWVVGWGRTRHLPHPTLTDALGRARGLCGAFGGNRNVDPAKRPTCQHCVRLAKHGAPA